MVLLLFGVQHEASSPVMACSGLAPGKAFVMASYCYLVCASVISIPKEPNDGWHEEGGSHGFGAGGKR